MRNPSDVAKGPVVPDFFHGFKFQVVSAQNCIIEFYQCQKREKFDRCIDDVP
jgi:hypothetical protein